TLGPHAYYWFALQAPSDSRRALKKRVAPTIQAPAEVDVLLGNGQREKLEREILPNYVRTCRWFGSKARTFRDLKVIEQLGISAEADGARLWFVEISYLDGPTETYAVPVKIASGEAARSVSQAAPHAIIAHFEGSEGSVLFDAIWDATFRLQLFEGIVRRQTIEGRASDVIGLACEALETGDSVVSGKSQIL